MSVLSQASTATLSAEQLAALPPEFRALLQSIIEHYERRYEALDREVAELNAELQSVRKTPWNSSLPPGSEHPHAKPDGTVEGASGEVAAKEKHKKKRGGQKGHPKHERRLVPVEQCDEVGRASRPRVAGAGRACGWLATIPIRCGIRCGTFPSPYRSPLRAYPKT